MGGVVFNLEGVGPGQNWRWRTAWPAALVLSLRLREGGDQSCACGLGKRNETADGRFGPDPEQ